MRLRAIDRRLPATLYLWPTAQSYTRQPCGELHTLGSPPLLEAVLEALGAAGARPAGPGEFTLRAFLGGRLDLTQAEAVLAVIDARHGDELSAALRQLAGGVAEPLHRLRSDLLDLLADLEAGLDFAEEEISLISRPELLARLGQAEAALAALGTQMQSRGVADGLPRVVLRGWPNVGKSSLFNALLGRDLALVNTQAHTTRDYLRETWPLGHLRVELVDTAGIDPDARGALGSAAQALSGEEHGRADWTLLCLDSTRPLNRWEQGQLGLLERATVVWTKCDAAESSAFGPRRSGRRETRVEGRETEFESGVATSAHTGAGLDLLRRHLADVLTRSAGRPEGCVASTAARSRDCLRRATAALERARTAARQREGDEVVALELRAALDELGRVTGAVYTDDVLDRVFSRFCIGK